MNNHNLASFAGSSGRDMVYLGHLKNFFDLNEESTLELGASLATGPNDDGHRKNRTTLEGIDLTYKWRPLKEGLYKSIIFQNEALFSQKDNVVYEEGADPKQVNSWGAYSSLVYQFAKRWPYFVNRFGLGVDCELEPKPGIPPSPGHLKEVIDTMKQKNIKVILMEVFYDEKPAKFVAEQTGATSSRCLNGIIHAAVYKLSRAGVYAGDSLLRLQLIYLIFQLCDLYFQLSHFVFIRLNLWLPCFPWLVPAAYWTGTGGRLVLIPFL